MTEEKAIKILEHTKRNCGLPEQGDTWKPNAETIALDMAINALEKQKDNGWIPCSERLPKVETEVLILAKRKIRDGYFRYITTTAMYEDGTVSKSDSCWYWYDIECKYDKENDCYIIPEGWREIKHYNSYNNQVDDEVIAWQPLPVPYKEANNDRY